MPRQRRSGPAVGRWSTWVGAPLLVVGVVALSIGDDAGPSWELAALWLGALACAIAWNSYGRSMAGERWVFAWFTAAGMSLAWLVLVVAPFLAVFALAALVGFGIVMTGGDVLASWPRQGPKGAFGVLLVGAIAAVWLIAAPTDIRFVAAMATGSASLALATVLLPPVAD